MHFAKFLLKSVTNIWKFLKVIILSLESDYKWVLRVVCHWLKKIDKKNTSKKQALNQHC
jgi:hypothetical protein